MAKMTEKEVDEMIEQNQRMKVALKSAGWTLSSVLKNLPRYKTLEEFNKSCLPLLRYCDNQVDRVNRFVGNGSSVPADRLPDEMAPCDNCGVPLDVYDGVMVACWNCGNDKKNLNPAALGK